MRVNSEVGNLIVGEVTAALYSLIDGIGGDRVERKIGGYDIKVIAERDLTNGDYTIAVRSFGATRDRLVAQLAVGRAASATPAQVAESEVGPVAVG